jgi:hypothetical protein
VRRGVLWALRSRAAVDVLFSAGLPGRWAKRSGRGVFVDLIPRMHMCEGAVMALGCVGNKVRIDDGRRNTGGSRPQLRGAFGGIVWCCGVDAWFRDVEDVLEIFGMRDST